MLVVVVLSGADPVCASLIGRRFKTWLPPATSNMADTGSRTEIRTALSNPGGWKSLIVFFVLALAWLAGFSARLFAVIRFESIIHEFDPW